MAIILCYYQITKLQLLLVIIVISNEIWILWDLKDSPGKKANPGILRYRTKKFV